MPRFLSSCVLAGVFGMGLLAQTAAQTAAKVDFAHDVQPIFQQNCVSCHGPHKAIAGLHMDQRGSVEKPFARLVNPGSSANSSVYLRVAGKAQGPTMPPTGDLKPEQVETIKQWIEAGALWPDELANDTPLPPVNPRAAALIALLHEGQVARFEKAAAAEPALLNARGPEGTTPLMAAALYADAAVLDRLLKLGGDPNHVNDAGATALMWTVQNLAKTRLLVEHGAKVNVGSLVLRTPLMIAARTPGNLGVVEYLVEHGANLNPNAHPQGQSSPLIEALTAGDADSAAYLIAHGADVKASGGLGLGMAITSECSRCVEQLVPAITDKRAYTEALQGVAHMVDLKTLQMLVEHGADVNAFDTSGRTPLMYAAQSDMLPAAEVKLLLAHGAEVNAKSKHPNSGDTGLTALDMALEHGETPISQLLEQAGGQRMRATPVSLTLKERGELRGAITANLPVLQHADERFLDKAGCASCHNNSLTAMTVSLARHRGLPVDDLVAAAQVKKNIGSLASIREILLQGALVPVTDNFGDNVLAYIDIGLAGEGYAADENTDAVAHYLLMRQNPDGNWPYPKADTRQPICLMYMGQTALAMHALQLYPPRTQMAEAHNAVELAARWLARAESFNNDDRSWRVTGLAWAGTNQPALQKAMKELLATQKPDGGWSDLPSMRSDAYATGKSLTALATAGLPTTSAAYRRGVTWLMQHQSADGTWQVATRALGFQPAFDAEFPGGVDQWISAAATNWADMALALTLPDGRRTPATGARRAVAARPSEIRPGAADKSIVEGGAGETLQ